MAEPVTRYIDDNKGFSAQPPWDDLYVVVTCKICYEYMLIAHPKDETNSYQYRKRNKRLWPDPGKEISSKIPESLRLEHKEARACFSNVHSDSSHGAKNTGRGLLGERRQQEALNTGSEANAE